MTSVGTEEVRVRSIRMFLLFMILVGCGARDDLSLGMSEAQALREIACVLRWTTHGAKWFAEETALYDGRDADVILGFYRGADISGDIVAPLETLEVRGEEDTGLTSPFDLPVYHTTFAVDLRGEEVVIDPIVFSFFDAAGRQQLGPEEDISLHFVTDKPGSPVSTNLPLSVAGFEEETGECRLVYDR